MFLPRDRRRLEQIEALLTHLTHTIGTNPEGRTLMALVDDDLAAALALKDTVDTFITKIEAVLASGGTDQAKLQQIADALAATKADVDAASARDLPPEG